MSERERDGTVHFAQLRTGAGVDVPVETLQTRRRGVHAMRGFVFLWYLVAIGISNAAGNMARDCFLRPEQQEAAINSLGDIARDRFHFEQGFKGFQSEAAAAVINGRNCVVISPTGSEKTYAFLAPLCAALAFDKKAWMLYVSPTLSLLDEMHLKFGEFGLASAIVTGETPGAEYDEILDNLVKGKYQALNTTPEALYSTEKGKALLRKLDERAKSHLFLVVLDEMQQVKHWGETFRKPLQKLDKLRSWIPAITVLTGCSGSVTQQELNGLTEHLINVEPRETKRIILDCSRENIFYGIRKMAYHHMCYAENLACDIPSICETVTAGGRVIIYAQTRAKSCDLYDVVSENEGVRATLAQLPVPVCCL